MKKKFAFNFEIQATFNPDVYLEIDETKATLEEAEAAFEKAIRSVDDIEELVYRAGQLLPDGVKITDYDSWRDVSGDPNSYDIEFDDIREIKD